MARRRKGGKLSEESVRDSQRISSESDIRSSVESNESVLEENMELKDNVVEKSENNALSEDASSQQKSEVEFNNVIEEVENSIMKDISKQDFDCEKNKFSLSNVDISGISPKANDSSCSNLVKNTFGNFEKDNLLPQDIQQIVLGDLKSVTLGQCEEIIADSNDINWDEDEEEESVICEEVEADTESQITEDDVSERNMDTYENIFSVKGDSNDNDCKNQVCKEIKPSKINMSQYDENKDVYEYSQGGSCEIIVVSKESDYENSQESFDNENDMEMECSANISAVLGVDTHNCSINISKDNSDDEEVETSNTKLSIEDNDVDDKLISSLKNHILVEENQNVPLTGSDQCTISSDRIDSTNLIKDSFENISLHDDIKVANDEMVEASDAEKQDVVDINTSESEKLDESVVDSSIVGSDINDVKKVNSFSIFQSISGKKTNDISLSPVESVKARSKTEDEKQPTFRSRSGSSDTTGSGSESGSTSSSGRRRSGRIKTVGGSRLNEKTSSKHGSSGTGSPVLVAPIVPGFDSDKPVKVKSRWRRSSELEMGSRVSTDSSSLMVSSTTSVNNITAASTTSRVSATSAVTSSCPDTTSGDSVPVLPPPSASSSTSSPASSSTPLWPSVDTTSPKNDAEFEEKLRAFVHLDSNEYHTGRSRSKETKRMLCDCFLTKEEIQRCEKGCGEDCLNRLLMIECGSRCILGDSCTNKRFQSLEYIKSEIFKTKKKGYGLKSLEDIPVGTFIMEYVGEVVDPKEFRRRAKEYAKDKNLHYYFMALKSDAIIDATIKGNNSRFINHSCEPNAETQKWTVNGELRIGFFSKRTIAAGEEITFDYQFQRYGKEAQRCYCESASCRGWIGEDPEKEGKWSDSGSRKERKEKKKKRDVKDLLNDMDLEEEIEKLAASGLKNRAHTLTLCRLMVRAEEADSRRRLLKLLRHGDTACLRLFLDYHGLRLVWSWMMESNIDLKTEILETLSKLPIPNKTMLQDSKVLTIVEKWASADKTSLLKERKERSQSEDDSEAVDTEADGGSSGDSEKMIVNTSDMSGTVAEELDKANCKEERAESEKVIDNDEETKTESEVTDISYIQKLEPSATTGKDSPNIGRFKDLASGLLSEWSSLKEVFRIPKKERIEQMKEHEREADRGYRERPRESDRRDRHYDRWDRYSSDYDRRDRDRDRYRDRDRDRDRDRERDRDRDRERDRDRDKDRKRSRESPDYDRPSKRVDDKNAAAQKLSKSERRQLFMMKVEEEDRQKKQQEEMWQQHQEQCLALGMDPNSTAAFNPQTGYPCFFDSATQTWQPYPTDPNLPHPDGKMDQNMYPPPPVGCGPPMFNHNQSLPYNDPSQPPPFVDTSHPPPFIDPNQPPPFVDTSQPPPFVDTSQPPPFMDPSQGPFPPPGAMFPMHPGSGYPVHDGNAQFPPTMPQSSQFEPHPFHGPPGHFGQPGSFPSPVPQTQPFQSMPMGPPFPPQNFNNSQQFQPPLPQSPCSQPYQASVSQNSNDPTVPFQPPLAQEIINQNIHPPLPQSRENTQAQVLQQGFAFTTTGTNSTSDVTTTDNAGLPVYVAAGTAPPPPPAAVRLPPKWKSVKDSEGRTYYYHVKTRVSQWEPPIWDQNQQPQPQESDSSSETDDDSDEDSSSSSDEDEEEEDEEKNEIEDEVEEEPEPEYDDAFGIEDNDISIDRDNYLEPSSVDEFTVIEDSIMSKRKREGLVQERIISPRTEFELEKTDKKKYREVKEKLKRHKAKLKEKLRLHEEKKHSHRHNKLKTSSKCEADTSSDPARKIKDNFRLNMAGVIVHYLNPYRKPDCKMGRITNTEDFKHLARKLTHFVMLKELKHCRSVDELDCNDNVKHKARDFIKKYMAKYGSVYQRMGEDE